MRVTQSMVYRQTLASMTAQNANVVKLQDSLSSGVRLTQAADDPSAMSRVIRNDDRQQQLSRYLDNLRGLESRLGIMENELGGVTNLMHHGRELLVQGGNASLDQGSLAAVANELRGLGEDALRIANARDGQGNYLFAGNLDNARPFSGPASASVYAGSAVARNVPIDEGAGLDDSLPGDQVFLNGPAGDIIAMFGEIADILENTASPTRQADIDASFNRMDAALDHVLGFRASLGQDLQRIDNERDRIELADIEVATDSSALRDTDFPATVAAMSIELTSLQAARQTFSQIQGLSLFDYLR